MYETFGAQGCVGDRGSISGGGVESTLGHRGLENANFVRGRFHGGEFSEVKVLHGRSKREEAWFGLRASKVGEPVTRVLVQTHVAVLSVRGRAGCRKMCWMLCSLISPKTIRIRMRRSINAGIAHPHIQQGLPAVSHARVFGRPASTNGSEVATERGFHHQRWHSVSTHFSRHIRCKPVRKRCEDAGGNSRTICQGELREQFLSSTWGSCQQPGNHWRELSWVLEHWPLWQPSPTSIEDLQHLANLWEEGSRNTSLSNVSSWTRNFSSKSSGQRGEVQHMTSDHLFPLLESERDSVMFAEFAQSLAVADVPHQVLRILGLGRLIALKKPDGGVRGIVVGDVLRRLVGRTMAKQVTKEVEAATSPFQYALSTRSGCECVTHVLQTLTELDEDATIVSVDGIGAYDLISRKAMLDGLLSVEQGEQFLLFVRSFYGAPSTYLWEDEMGTNHRKLQGEGGGEQGDPLMPLLFNLGQHRAYGNPGPVDGGRTSVCLP